MSHILLIAVWLLTQSTLANGWKIHVTNTENGIAEFEEGTNVHLSCSVQDLPADVKPEIHWIDVNSRIIKSRFMVWHNVNSEHEGKYKCIVNVDGEEERELVELKIHKYPKFLTMNHDQHFEIGSTARLQCLVTEPQKADLFWTRNDMPIVPNDRFQFDEFGTVLVIQNYTTADNDQYACNLPKANSFETFDFNVAGTSKAKILQFIVPDVVLEGRDALLKCEFTGLPWPKLRLYKATSSLNKELITTSEKYHFDGNLLIIRNISEADIGEYTCAIENFMSSESSTVQLNVDTKPRIRKGGQFYANLDETMNVTCSASGKNTTLSWYTNEFTLIPCDDLEQKYSCIDNGTKSTLIYRNVSEEDSRTFSCVAVNKAGEDHWSFKVELTKSPQIFKNEASTVRVIAGTKFELTCEATGIPNVEWTWYQNDSPILGVTDVFFVNSTESNLSTLTAKTAQAGNFSCEAKNQVGSDRSQQTEVLLVEVPQLPEIECSEDSLLPNRAVCNGNFDNVPRERLPTGFHVEVTVRDEALLTDVSIVDVPYTGDIITVRQLNSTTDYRLRFKAFNEAGESNWSEPLAVSTSVPTAPESPSNVHWHCDVAKCSFNWPMPEDNGKPIVGYYVQVSQPNNTEDDSFDKPVFEDTIGDNSIAIYSLTSNAFYKFRVQATNEIGASDFAVTEFQVGDQPASSVILAIVLVCLLVLILLVVVVVVFMTRCRKQLGGKSAVLNDPSSIEEGQTLVPQSTETKHV